MQRFSLALLVLFATMSACSSTCADEGLWLFNNPPSKLLCRK
jgi:hypothetical protein